MNRTTMRSALLTVAPFAERCLQELTSLNRNKKCLVMGGFERLLERLLEHRAGGARGGQPAVIAVIHVRREPLVR